MKNKIKKIALTVLTLFLVILIGISIVFAATDVRNTIDDTNKTAAVLNSKKILSYQARDMAKYNNLYCVCHSRAMDSSLVDKSNIRLIAVAMVEIDGNNAKFYKVDTDGKETYVGENDASQNNVMAGIISAEEPETVKIKDKNGNEKTFTIYKGYGGLPKVRDTWPMFSPEYSITQVAIHKYYETWRKSIPEGINPGFETDSVDWTNIDDNKELAADEYIKQIKASKKTYSAKMYFLKLKCDEISGWSPYQNTILVEPISKLNIPVEKIWDDNDNENGIRPSEIEVKLLKNGKEVDSLKLNAKNKWKGEFKDLDKKDKDGNDIKYEIKEVKVTGYGTKISGSQSKGFKITNSLKTRDITVNKVWEDNNNEDGFRPDAIEVELFADGKTTNKKAILNSSNGWKYTFEKLSFYNKDKEEIEYTIKENGIPKEYSSKTTGSMKKGFTITNTQEIIKIKVIKVWEDKNNADGIRPEKIEVELFANNKSTNKIITLNAKTKWEGVFENLQLHDENNKEIKYTVKEKGVPDEYASVVTGDMTKGFTITNTQDTIEVKVIKVWEDNNNADGIRPDKIEVQLLANGKEKGKPVILNADNNWSYTFKGLPKDDKDEKLYTYTVKEINLPEGYAAVITGDVTKGFTVTNTQETVEVKVAKIWEDNNNEDKIRPNEIEVQLYADGQEKGEPIKLNDTNNWKHTFKALIEKNAEGKQIEYTLKEINIPEEYVSVITGDMTKGYIITNTQQTIELGITKIWDDEDDADEIRPNEIEVQLLANGKEKGKTVILNADNNWTYMFNALAEKDKDGNVYTYTIKEINVPEGYISKIEGNMQQGFEIINTHEVKPDGYVEITGTVWEDEIDDYKANTKNGILDENDTKMGGIKVVLKDAQGNPMSCTYADENGEFTRTDYAITQADGTYKIRVNYDNSEDVYKLFEDSSDVAEKLKTAYVEFEYNANKYTTVKTGTSGENTSKAKENATIRDSFDNTYGRVPTLEDVPPIDQQMITAKTQSVITFETYSDVEQTQRGEITKYCYGNGKHVKTNFKSPWLDIIEVTNDSRNHVETCSGTRHILKEQDVDVTIIKNVNLGLTKREQPDVAIFSDISKVKVTMKGQEYTYIYNVRNNEKNNVGLKTKFQEKDTYVYKRPVNPADIAYVNKVDNKAMSVEVTYEVSLANLSTTLPVTIHNFDNYYDSRYTIDTLKTPDWNETRGSRFNVAQYNKDITLQPGTESEKIQITYTVSQDAIIGLLKEDATLNSAVEIHSYSIFYGERTICAEGQTGESSNKTGSLYGGYDKDSHPGNANIELRTGDDGIERLYSTDAQGNIISIDKVEDDTDFAPSFVLTIERDNNKIISGNVWEDSDANPNDAYRIGDGKKSATEKNVENVKVELYKIKDDGSLELAELYSINENTAEIDVKKAETYTDANGNYSFGDTTFSVPTDRYIVKFIYGENIENSKTSSINDVNISARNYKSTIINANSNMNPIFKGSDNEEWHLNISKGETIAVDNMDERVAISDLQYNNFNNTFNITACSKPFAIQIEPNSSESKESNVGTDGKTEFNHNINVFDFGIVERAREDIFVETTVEYLKITLGNGQVLLEGDPRTSELNYTKIMGLNKEIKNGTSARDALEKQVLIEIDTELLQNAQVEMKYAIKVTNNSEKDFDYYLGDETSEYDPTKQRTEYYYFGTNNENSPEINASANYVVDYLDSELTYTWENPDDWTLKTADELLNEGLISEATYNAIKEQEYVTYITTKFSNLKPGESMEDHIIAKKLLANEDENVYDNHAEILQIDAKIARTQKETGIAKEYKMGNYVPSLATRQISSDINLEIAGLHEQDDDRIKIVITPPTGVTQYIITYTITGLIGLIAVAIMVIFIKKKLVNK